MNCLASRLDMERFRAAIVQRIGLQFDDTKLGFLAEVLQRRLDTLGRVSDAYSTGKMPTGQLADAALVLVGGIMLILPGFFTDIIGLVCLLPFTRPLARRLIGLVLARQVAKSGLDVGVMRAHFAPDTVIKGETVDTPPTEPPQDPQVIRGEIED